jgi:hypothetical protein
MQDKRNNNRRRKRIPLRYSLEGLTRVAFTDDITREGMFIRSVHVAVPGTRLQVELDLPGGKVALVAEVRWSRKVPPAMLQKLKGGMGMKILAFQSGVQFYRDLCDELYGPASP